MNEQTVWTEPKNLEDWLAAVTQRSCRLPDSVISDFLAVLNRMREVLYDLHFHRNVDLSDLNTQLRGIQLGFQPEIGILPRFRAWALDEGDAALLLSVGATALVQFAGYIGEVLAGRPLDLLRCEGLFRDANMNSLSPVQGLNVDKELEWRSEIPILIETNRLESPEVHRCADFFPGGKGKFCSDACRFTTFQLLKQLKDPDYLAEKQRRYRARKK